VPLENQLLKLNQKISYDLGQVLSYSCTIRETMRKLEDADELNRQINTVVEEANEVASRVLKKLRRFKQDNFRPKIKGIDAESDVDLCSPLSPSKTTSALPL